MKYLQKRRRKTCKQIKTPQKRKKEMKSLQKNEKPEKIKNLQKKE